MGGTTGRCGHVVLDFLTSTDVGRLSTPLEEGDDAASKVSEWELQECLEQEEEWKASELDAAGGGGAMKGLPLFLRTASFMASSYEE